MSTALEMRRRLRPDPAPVQLLRDDPLVQAYRRTLERRHESDRRRRELQARTLVFMGTAVVLLSGFFAGVLWLLSSWEAR